MAKWIARISCAAQRRTHLKYGLVVLLFLAVFSSRVPFLDNGYGIDSDAWRIARAGIKMAKTGEYSCSRKPCYPLPEIAYWLMTPTSDRVFNGLNLRGIRIIQV